MRSGPPSDSADPSRVDLTDIFRRAHSLKGAARAVDMPRGGGGRARAGSAVRADSRRSAVTGRPTVAAMRLNLDTIEDLVADATGAPAPPVFSIPTASGKPRRRNRSALPRTEVPGHGRDRNRRLSARRSNPDGAAFGFDASVDGGASAGRGRRRGVAADRTRHQESQTQLGRAADAGRVSRFRAKKAGNGHAMPAGNATSRVSDFDQDLKTLFRKLSALPRP